MLELRKRHMDGCKHFTPKRSFSKTLDCKRCPYFAVGTFGGKKIRQSLDTWSAEEARLALVTLEADLKNPKPEMPQVTVEMAVQSFLSEMDASERMKSTVKRYRTTLKALVAFLSSNSVVNIGDVTDGHISAYKATWKIDSKTKEQERMKMFFRWCIKRKYTKENPCDSLMPIQAKKKGGRVPFTEAQVRAIYKALDELYPLENPNWRLSDYASHHHVKALLMVMENTGLAFGDAISLRRSDVVDGRMAVDLAASRMTELRRKKNDAVVMTKLPPLVLDALAMIKTPGDHYFYPGNEGTLESWKKKWDTYVTPIYRRAGVKGKNHAWRDTFAIRLLQAGTELRLVSKLLGHASTVITEKHYLRWVPGQQDMLEEALDRFHAKRRTA